jgi:hypothetical protein
MYTFSSDQSGWLLRGLNGIYDSGTIDSLLTSLRTRNIISEAKMEELLATRSKDKNESVRLLYSIIVTLDLFKLMAVRDIVEGLG